MSKNVLITIGIATVVVLVVEGVVRTDVQITGTTFPPGFARPEGKVGAVCPESHPFNFDDAKSCCSQKARSAVCGGSTSYLEETDSLDCCSGVYVACTKPPCRANDKAFEIPGSWSEWTPWSTCTDCGEGMNVQRSRTCLPTNPRTVCPPGETTETDYHCIGGDSCCTSSNICGAGQGDCDLDSQCEEGLYCGVNNCEGDTFQPTDDCCYAP